MKHCTDVSPVHCLSTVDTERQLATSSRSQRRLRGVELVARRVRLRRHDGCWGRVAAATTHDDDDDDEEMSDNDDERPRQQLLGDTTTTSQCVLTAGTTSLYSDYGELSAVFNERKSFSSLFQLNTRQWRIHGANPTIG